jgi:hypothetical protein
METYLSKWLKSAESSILGLHELTGIEIEKLEDLVRGHNRMNLVERKFIAAILGLEAHETGMTAEEIDSIYYEKSRNLKWEA